YEKQNYRINLSVYKSTYGETAIISQDFSGIIIENTPDFFIKGSEDLTKVLKSGEVGFCFGYNNRLSKVFLVEMIQDLLQNEFKNVVYLSSKQGQLLSYEIPTIFLEKQVKDFNSFSAELFKIYKYIIIEDYDLSKYITEIESLKNFIILVSSIDYFTPLKCLRILLDKEPWKITNISLSGLMMDIGDFNKKPFIIGDFFRIKSFQTFYNNDETWINELIKYRNSFLSQLKTSISLPPGLLEKVKITLGIDDNEY
ncbi:hypothetical protein KAU33_15195, partial [Candidatus Dependentiae bacterium]|nr:hypothetical protein [Candidatus Dependentiae bacterium]